MRTSTQAAKTGDIEYSIVFSHRRTLGIAILPDATVVVRAPFRTPAATINDIVEKKSDWIRKHLENYRRRETKKLNGEPANGNKVLYRGRECTLVITRADKPFVTFRESTVEVGTKHPDNSEIIKRLLNAGYSNEAARLFPVLVNDALVRYRDYNFRITGLVLRTMKSRWGTCSRKGVITLNTELVKLPDIYTEYVIAHELCHLRHHNHGKEFYKLLEELFPGWKSSRKALRDYIH